MKKGFTLIELLVVVAIIGILAAVTISNLNTARAKAEDARRRVFLQNLKTATEMYYIDYGEYPASAGWVNQNNVPAFIANVLDPYMNDIPDEYIGPSANILQYWRKDNGSTYCGSYETDKEEYAYYMYLRAPASGDTSTFTDDFDNCVKTTWPGFDIKVGT